MEVSLAKATADVGQDGVLNSTGCTLDFILKIMLGNLLSYSLSPQLKNSFLHFDPWKVSSTGLGNKRRKYMRWMGKYFLCSLMSGGKGKQARHLLFDP